MVAIGKYVLLVVAVLMLLPFVSADRVGIVAQFPNGETHGECVSVAKDTNGFDLLEKSSLDLEWAGPSAFGHQLCKVNGVGDDVSGSFCEFSGQYWGFFTGRGDSWEYMPVGFDGQDSCWNDDLTSFSGHYCAEEGDFIGLRYGEFNDPLPPFFDFDDLCAPLKVKEIEVKVDGKKESSADEDGGEIEARPESEIEFEIELENIFEFDDTIEVEDIEAEITVEDIDDNDDIEIDFDFDDIDVDDEEKEKIKFTLPLLVDEGSYDLILDITGDTTNNIRQEIVIEYDLEVEKENYELLINNVALTKDTVCQGDTTFLSFYVVNVGSKDEENILLTVSNPELDLFSQDTFDLEEGDARRTLFEKELRIDVPANAVSAEHFIKISAEANAQATELVSLTVQDCSESTSAAAEKEETFTQPATNQVTQPEASSNAVTGAVVLEKSFFQKNAPLILLAIFLGLLAILILAVGLILNS